MGQLVAFLPRFKLNNFSLVYWRISEVNWPGGLALSPCRARTGADELTLGAPLARLRRARCADESAC